VRLHSLIVVIAILIILFNPASAQTPIGILRGQVTDPSGAVVPNAQVAAVGPNGQTSSTKSGPNGAYEIGELPPGKYTLTAKAPGFADFTQLGLDIAAGRSTFK